MLQPSPVTHNAGRSYRWSSRLSDGRVPSQGGSITNIQPSRTEGTWEVVGADSSNAPSVHRFDDLMSISYAAFAKLVAAHLVQAWSLSLPTRHSLTPTSAADARRKQSLIEAAKERWRSRAYAEARFAERLLASAPDTEGLPMPRIDGDDDEP